MIKIFDENNDVYKLIKDLTINLNIEVLEVNSFRSSSSSKIQVVLFKEEGFNVDTLSEAHKMILLKLESSLDYDFSLELSTPGIERKLKTNREFIIFEGKKIKLMLDNDFEEGIIFTASSDEFLFKVGSETKTISYSEVKKAKLV